VRGMFVHTRFGVPAFWQIAAGFIVLLGAIALIAAAAISNINWLLLVGIGLAVAAGAAIAVGVSAIDRHEQRTRQQAQADLTGEAVARSLRRGKQGH
jgi:membrane protein implicated in regulation of membrane protease activity